MARNLTIKPEQAEDPSIHKINTDLASIDLLYDGAPLIIAGPCSAESESQVIATAKELARISGIKIFRAGLWKPRTRPNFFEGVGDKGLAWLQRVKQETGLLTATEVAAPRHIENCLNKGVDFLWIGARTTVNPFMVEELANALRGVDIPVLVKNPINPEISLWIGAIERIHRKGVRKITAIHRGFSNGSSGILRNDPNWMIPIELKRRLPRIPLLCDPSHMAGKREWIRPLAQMALDFGMDGLMIESHNNPIQALSDAAQQLAPTDLKELINELVLRRTCLNGQAVFQDISQLRTMINMADLNIINALSERMRLVKNIGTLKREHNIPVFQLDRWNALLQDRISKGLEKGLEAHFVKRLFDLIHTHSVEAQFT